HIFFANNVCHPDGAKRRGSSRAVRPGNQIGAKRPPLFPDLISKPVSTQVEPARVLLLDEAELLLPAPALQFFLAGDGVVDMTVGLGVDKPVDTVFRGEALEELLLVLPHPSLEMVRDTDVD